MEANGYKMSKKNPDFEVEKGLRKFEPRIKFGKDGYFYFALTTYGYSYVNLVGPYRTEIVAEKEKKGYDRQFNSEVNGEYLFATVKISERN